MDIKNLVAPRIPAPKSKDTNASSTSTTTTSSSAPSLGYKPSLNRSESTHRTAETDTTDGIVDGMPKDRLKFHHPAVLSKQKSLEEENSKTFDTFVKWLLDNGAKFPGLYFKCYGSDQRGVHCKQDIERNRRILYVPRRCLITDQVARRTKTGQRLLAIEKRLSAPNHNQIIVFMLEDMRRPDSFFKPYYDILPKDVSNFPVFWKPHEVKWLEGSNLPDEIVQRRKKIRSDYDIIGDLLPDFFEHVTFEKFLWCRTIVGSRNFTITIDGGKRTSMVPQADMLNHYRPRETSWTFENDLQCFTITSLKPLKAGQQVMDSYGKKCNSKFLLHYGFAVETNREANGVCLNKVPLTMSMRDDDPNLRDKPFMVPRVKRLNVSMNHQSKETRDALNFARVTVANAEECRTLGKSHVGLVALRNEVAAVRAIADSLKTRLKGYPTSYAHDQAAVKKLKPFTNERNAMIVMMGEKEIIHMWMQCADEIESIVAACPGSSERTKMISTKFSGKDDDISRFIVSFNRSLVLRGY